ncbi:MAG: DUF2023 family protein [Rikenellaceae bacterium]
MQVLCHHIYEYQKGLRHLVLHTMSSLDREAAEQKLSRYDVDYMITELSNGNINIFFGKNECVDVVRSFGNVPLNLLTVEQDFILGIMLGYDRLAQCSRYLKRNESNRTPISIKDGRVETISAESLNFQNIGLA